MVSVFAGTMSFMGKSTNTPGQGNSLSRLRGRNPHLKNPLKYSSCTDSRFQRSIENLKDRVVIMPEFLSVVSEEWMTDSNRAALLPHIKKLEGLDLTRAQMKYRMSDWIVRDVAPLVLEGTSFDWAASDLRELNPIFNEGAAQNAVEKTASIREELEVSGARETVYPATEMISAFTAYLKTEDDVAHAITNLSHGFYSGGDKLTNVPRSTLTEQIIKIIDTVGGR